MKRYFPVKRARAPSSPTPAAPSAEAAGDRAEQSRLAALARLEVRKRRRESGAVGFGQLDQLLRAAAGASWMTELEGELGKPYWRRLKEALVREHEEMGKTVYPATERVFAALELTPLPEVRVVVLGQDPYHGPGQAEGLSFSVPRGVKVPSSLRNIYKELASDVPGFRAPQHGHLAEWAERGVLLLNTALTVRRAEAGSHSKLGWHEFTTAVIRAVSRQQRPVVFLLWGKHAQSHARLVDTSRHHILQCAHPSGLSAHRGFFGCKHFSKANALLTSSGRQPIDWHLSQ